MKPLNWPGGLKRLGLIYASCGAVAVAAVLIGEPFWFTVCPSSYTLDAKPDPVDQERYARDIRQQIDSGCSIRPAPPDVLGRLNWDEEIKHRRLAIGEGSVTRLAPATTIEASRTEMAAALRGGSPKPKARCKPIAPLAHMAVETVQVSLPEVVSCSVQSSFWTITESRGLRLALVLLSLPLVGLGLFRTGRWVWRGFRSD